MKIKSKIIVVLLFTVFASCDDIDNLDGPDAGISGVIIDETTNEGIKTDQPNGAKIRLVEDGYENVIPQDFWAKSDGTFMNTQLFSNSYTVRIIEGAFIEPSEQRVTLNKGEVTDISFTVVPFMSINASEPVVVGNNIQISYTLSKPGQISWDIQETKTLVSTLPSVSTFSNQYSVSNNLSGLEYSEIAETTYTDVVEDLPSGEYYVRVGGRTNNPNGRYNYSETFMVTIQ
ncbi:MAG: DUF3823 domain-containing protein [Arenibacter algicola]